MSEERPLSSYHCTCDSVRNLACPRHNEERLRARLAALREEKRTDHAIAPLAKEDQ